MIPRFYARDFIETQEGWAFALIADGPVDGKLWGTLRYRRVGNRWAKINSMQATELLAQDPYKRLRYVEQFDATLPEIDLSEICQHYDPVQRLSEFCSTLENHSANLSSEPITNVATPDASPALFKKLQTLVEWLVAQQVPRESLGITGSWLLNAQTSQSDIDLIIVGRAHFDRARKALAAGVACGMLEPLDPALWAQAHARRGTSLTLNEYRWHEERKGIHASIGGTKIDLSLRSEVLLPAPGKKVGRAEVVAAVVDDQAAFDLPARWTIAHPAIKEILTWTATFVGQVQKGEVVQAIGAVEQLANGQQRLVIGSDREAVSDRLVVLRVSESARP